jgi:UDP:flavonoid glycosyltransferase YjiC (YdhE family)
VEHGWGVTAMPETRPYSADELAGELAELGIDGLPDPALELSVCPPGFGARRPGLPGRASAQTSPDRLVQPLRYVAYNGPGVLPDWALTPRRSPRIFLTFGSLTPQLKFRDFVALLGQIAVRLPEVGAEVVVGIDASFAQRLGSLPAGVVGVGWHPLNLVLGSIDLLVHHGGSGSMMSALAAGVPQLALPNSADQFVNAFALADAGVGRLLMPDTAGGVEAVLAQCRALLAEPGYTDAAKALAVDVAAMPSPADVVDVLAKLVAR